MTFEVSIRKHPVCFAEKPLPNILQRFQKSDKQDGTQIQLGKPEGRFLSKSLSPNSKDKVF